MNRIWGFLFLSLSLHIFSGTVATVAAPRFAYNRPAKSSVVELLETTPKKKSQDERDAKIFAGKVQVPESFKVKREVRKQFYSEEDLTVLEQTRAAETGPNANRLNSGRKSDGQQHADTDRNIERREKGESKKFGVAALKTFEHGEASIGEQSREGDELKPLALPKISGAAMDQGKSTFAYAAPDIKVGKITALNTDRFVYFGFYQRTDERIYPHWENFVRAAIYTYQNTHRTFGTKEFNARYEILLRPDGTYEKSILRESSGVQGVDLALAQAFRRAKQIPHPPADMIQSDGFIHLNYGITVEIGPGQLADAE